MKNYPKRIKNTLHSVIRDMAKHPETFCRCPEKDFTRNRKLPFEKLLSLLIKMGGHSLRDEMLDCLAFQDTPASVSALVQQRSKLLPEALEYLFREFTNRCHNPKLYKGYRLLAVDGSDLQFTANPNDPLSYFPGVNGQKPYSFLTYLCWTISPTYSCVLEYTAESASEADILRMAESVGEPKR